MRIIKMMEKMGVQRGGIGSQKLRELMSFHLNMGKTEDETMMLVADKAEEVRLMQGISRQQIIDQAMVYMWQRYRDRWPNAVVHKAHSQSGKTNFYYTAPEGINAPPLWVFFVADGKFLLSHLCMGGLGNVAFSREEMLAKFAPKSSENAAGQLADYIHKNPDPKHQIDPVLVRRLYSGANFQHFASVWDAFKSLEIGADAEARKFRRVLKQKDRALWQQPNPEWEFLLKYPRNTERELVQDRAHEDGAITQTRSRKNQDEFRKDVAYNCYGLCVLTGASDFRCEAAHLVPHARKGGASYLNGIFLRCDLHKLFDNNLCAIDPVTMEMIFRDVVLASDPDLRAHHRRKVITRNPLNAENLQYRWEVYKSGNDHRDV